MTKARITDANEYFGGKEPSFGSDIEITEKQIRDSLNWYSKNRKTKDALKYASDFLKSKYKFVIPTTSHTLKAKGSTFCFLCRILTRGGVLDATRKEWFDAEVESLRVAYDKELNTVVETDDAEEKPKTPNIQDRIKEKAYECIAELEGLLDDQCTNNFKGNTQPYGIMHTLGIKGVHTRFILEWAKKKRSEFDSIIDTKDAFIKEGYSNFKKTDLKKIVALFDQVILDCAKVNNDATATRKPRKKKQKTPEQLVAKVKYCREFAELGLTSVSPKDIIGVMQLWVYNTKNRKMGVYHAEDAGGLTVTGTKLVNFSEKKSVHKTLRKPEVTIPNLMKAGKVALKNILGELTTKESAMNGRLTEDVILLRAVK